METKIYKPELLSRQGELNAWALAVVTAGAVVILSLRSQIPSWAWFLVGIFSFSAVSISIGNWMDRKTSITIQSDSITYQNAIRKVTLPWNDIQRVRTLPARWGTNVQVIGSSEFFAFTTFAEMKFRDEVKSQTGFKEGDVIKALILEMANLQKVEGGGKNVTIYHKQA